LEALLHFFARGSAFLGLHSVLVGARERTRRV
jgi:hypothetical protein